jgi:hypothetical protein
MWVVPVNEQYAYLAFVQPASGVNSKNLTCLITQVVGCWRNSLQLTPVDFIFVQVASFLMALKLCRRSH